MDIKAKVNEYFKLVNEELKKMFPGVKSRMLLKGKDKATFNAHMKSLWDKKAPKK